ncbi:MAG: Asp23/Gls24 family envelope stress response protein [SAR202 cluster bacterium]|nr:Asp23/Gls24 family envelope stress response protein [SAR202 cluster bacterium]
MATLKPDTDVQVESQPDIEVIESKAQPPALSHPAVMTGLTIRELEMLPRLEELSRIDTMVVEGSTAIKDEVIGAIACQATKEVEGVADVGVSSFRRLFAETFRGAERRARGVSVEAGRKEAIVDITVKLTYGFPVPQTVVDIRRNVAERLLNLCGLYAKEINVNVASLNIPSKMPGRVK